MYILAIETTGFFCSVAVIDEDDKIVHRSSDSRFNHLKELTPMIRELLEDNDISMEEIDAIATSTGPGSFTGIRIGVSTARGMSQMRGIPCISVPTIEAFALKDFSKINCSEDNRKENCSESDREAGVHGKPSEKRFISCPIFDARRKQIYGGSYVEEIEIVSPGAYAVDEYMEKLLSELKGIISNMEKDGSEAISKVTLSFKGDGAVRYKSEITRAITNFFERHSWKSKKPSSGENERADEVEQKLQWCTHRISVSLEFRNEYQDAVGIAILGKRKFLEEEFVEFRELLPVYMRKPEAQRNLEERLKKDQ